ncbi:MAG: LptF/LptG family permease, partial [Gammaproteobacteria bacterium]|nr:LptF/LptG family permease [Gammaproteobacteria bacterium]
MRSFPLLNRNYLILFIYLFLPIFYSYGVSFSNTSINSISEYLTEVNYLYTFWSHGVGLFILITILLRYIIISISIKIDDYIHKKIFHPYIIVFLIFGLIYYKFLNPTDFNKIWEMINNHQILNFSQKIELIFWMFFSVFFSYSITSFIKYQKLDKFIIKSFFPPFIATFFIAIFILLMQFLWKWVDELIGKGLEVNTILQLILYAAARFVPLALPIAMLIASIMTFGNMGEKNELSALKSSGISLKKMMKPLIILAVLFMHLSFLYF